MEYVVLVNTCGKPDTSVQINLRRIINSIHPLRPGIDRVAIIRIGETARQASLSSALLISRFHMRARFGTAMKCTNRCSHNSIYRSIMTRIEPGSSYLRFILILRRHVWTGRFIRTTSQRWINKLVKCSSDLMKMA